MLYQIEYNRIGVDSNYICEPIKLLLICDNKIVSAFESDKNYKRTNNFLNNLLNDKKFQNYLRKNFSFKGLCHWQFFPSYVWPYFFFYVEILNLLGKISIHNISSLNFRLKNNDLYETIFLSALEEFAEEKGIKLYAFKERTQHPVRVKKIKDFFYPVKVKLVRLTARYCKNKQIKKKNKHDNREILIFSPYVNIIKDAKYSYDRVFSGVIEKLNERYNMCFVSHNAVENYSNLKTGEVLDPFGIVDFIQYIFYYLQFAVMPLPKEKFSTLSKTTYLILKHIKKKFFHETIIKRIVYERMLCKIKPKAILLSYETGPDQRACLLEAQKKGIPTFGFQHGNIFSNHYDYMHARVSKNAQDFSFIVPTKMFVWGEFYKTILTKYGAYCHSDICVSGDWRRNPTDCKKTVTEKNNKRVLLLSCGVKTEIFIKMTAPLRKIFSDVKWLFKPHHHELPRLQSYDLEGLSCVEGNIDILMQRADLVITSLSTTVFDAMIHQIPVICFNHTKEKGWEEFQNIEGCFYCETEEKLEDNYRKLINLSIHEKKTLLKTIERTSKSFFECFGKEALENIVKVLDQRL